MNTIVTHLHTDEVWVVRVNYIINETRATKATEIIRTEPYDI